MSIETEFESTITNVKNAYQGLDNLGATIPQNKNIENIKSCLDEIYNKFPKTEYQEGTEITLSNTLKGKLDFENDIVGYGQTEQESTNGYNLFVDIATQTLNGITITRTDNGYILNGTSTAITTFRGTIPNPINSNKTLVAKCDTDVVNANIQVKTKSATQVQLRSISLSTKETWVVSSGEYEDVLCDIVIKSDVTLNNVLLQPMLLNGTYTTSNVPNYEQYSGGYASPSPNWEQEIEVVRGKNSCDINTKLENAVISSTAITNGAYTLLYKKISSGTYTISSTTNMQFVYCLTDNAPTTSTTGITRYVINNITSHTFSFEGDKYLVYRILFYDGATLLDNVDLEKINDEVQLEKSSQATSYLPYNTVEIEERGINKFDNIVINKSDDIQFEKTKTGCKLSAIQTSTIVSNLFALFIVGDTNKLNGQRINLDMYVNNLSNKFGYYIGYCDENGNNRVIIASSRTTAQTGHRTATMIVDNELYPNKKICVVFFGVDGYAPTAGDYTEFDNIMVYTGELLSEIPYEPYKEPKTYQLSLGEYEFAGIGNYRDYIWTDRSTGKWYKHGVIESKDKDFIVANLSSSVAEITDYARIAINGLNSISTANGLCNYFIFLASYSGQSNHFYIQGTQCFIIVDKTLLSSIDKTGATTFFNSIPQIKLYYVLATPTDTEITDTTLIEQLNNWYNSQSFTGTTIITSNGELPLVLKVRALKGE